MNQRLVSLFGSKRAARVDRILVGEAKKNATHDGVSSLLKHEYYIDVYPVVGEPSDSNTKLLKSYASDSNTRDKEGEPHIPFFVVLEFDADSEGLIRANSEKCGLEIAIARSGGPHLDVLGQVGAGKIEVLVRFTVQNSVIIVKSGLDVLRLDQPDCLQAIVN